jgi:Holliday junction resolvase RusA-like endonuclease
MNVPGIDVLVQLPGEPRGKGRPRAFVPRGRPRPVLFTDAKTEHYEKLIKGAARNAMGQRQQMTGPLDVTIEAVFEIPKSWPKYRRRAAMQGLEPHVSAPDADNVAKIALDGCNGIVWRDDSQVVRLTASKHYGPQPGLMIAVVERKVSAQVAA